MLLCFCDFIFCPFKVIQLKFFNSSNLKHYRNKSVEKLSGTDACIKFNIILSNYNLLVKVVSLCKAVSLL